MRGKITARRKHGRVNWRVLAGLVAILVLALVLRMWGNSFGLPYEYHVDEVQYVRQAASMGAEGLKPVWWNNPPFLKYIFLAEYGALYAVGRLLRWYASVNDFAAQHTLDPTRLYLLARSTNAFLGSLTVLLVYWLGKVAYNVRVGLVAAWFLATCFLHVRDSHFAVNDVAVTLLATLALFAAVRMAQTGQKRWYGLAGAALGLGFATKYSAAFALVPILIAHFYTPGVQIRPKPTLRLRCLALFVLVAAGTTVLASPYFVITPGKVVRDAYEALYLAGQQGFDGWQIDTASGYVFYLKTLVWGLGWALFLLSLVGMVVAALRHRPVDVVILSLPLIIYLIAGRQQMFFARFILPAVPALLVLGASLLEKLVTSWTFQDKTRAAGLAVGALIITLQPSVSSIRFDYLLTQTDTRTVAKNWVETHIPSGAKMAVDWPWYGPPLSSIGRQFPQSQRAYDVTIVYNSGLAEHSVDWYRQNGYDYLVASSFIYNIPLLDAGRNAERHAFYASLDQETALLKTFRPNDGGHEPPFIFDEVVGPAISLWDRQQPGPVLKIYQVNQTDAHE